MDFLGDGKYEAIIWADANDADINPMNLIKQTKFVTSKDKIKAKLAPAGGQVIYLKPVK